MSASTAFAFPGSGTSNGNRGPPESPSPSPRHARGPHLPFRRISLPSGPPPILNFSSSSATSTANKRASIAGMPLPPGSSLVPAGYSYMQMQMPSPDAGRRSRRTSMQQQQQLPVSAKRARIQAELLSTERAYVAGLDLVFEHFLNPLLKALPEGQMTGGILSRAEIDRVFSNFINIWDLHRKAILPILILLLLLPQTVGAFFVRHIPFLATYNPFVTNFGTTLDMLATHAGGNAEFATWLKTRETDPLCKSLGLRDWLLTIIQRCPRYLLLLKDLIAATDPRDPEHVLLNQAETMMSKLNTQLNTALATHGTTLALLQLQRICRDLPADYRLVDRGRTLLRRGPLRQIERGRDPRTREFLLFTDAILWLENESQPQPPLASGSSSASQQERRHAPTLDSILDERDRWTYKGRADLLDIQVVVPIGGGGEDDVEVGGGGGARFEILGPDGSFACVAANETTRDGWVSSIRAAKQQWLSSTYNVAGDSTLTSSQSTKHLRRALQAIPAEEDRETVEHFVEPVWVPDGKTPSCMRCGRNFGLQAMGMGGWRRRHHCRLCGRVVCSSCSAKTFFIYDPKADGSSNTVSLPSAESTLSLVEKLHEVKGKGKPARACNACYDAIFQPKSSMSSSVTLTGHNKHHTVGQSLPASATMSMPSLALAPTLEEPETSEVLLPGHGQEASGASARSNPGSPMLVHGQAYRPGSVYGYAGSSSSVNLLAGVAEGKTGFTSPEARVGALAASRRLSMPIVGVHAATVTTHTGSYPRRLSGAVLPETTERLAELLRSTSSKTKA
ncbi:hypothetical protein BKA62DRAFT_745007 [Auriculariales sp. MPI-PUGE-AT-0066]|nr:hypothetical protein BKA62DRAFT_745007 [Auriculariales sp. MPI-PUGE-AT-0066]